MYKHKKATALFMCMTIVFSLVLNPFSAAYASEPVIKLPTIGIPTINQPAMTAPLATIEKPARVQGTSYEFKDEVKRLPKTFDYEFKPMSLDTFASTSIDAKNVLSGTSLSTGTSAITSANIGTGLSNISLPGVAVQTTTPAEDENKLAIDKIDGIKYPAGSKILAVPKIIAASFAPKTNDIYVDEETGAAFRVLDTQEADEEGNPQYVVDTPQLTDIFKSYSIPEQTLDLTTGNIAYIAPEFELSPDSGMPKNYLAAAGLSDYVSFEKEGNKHILTLKTNTLIFEYPSREQQKEDKEAEKKAEKEKFEGDWWEKDQHGDLRGYENESSLSVQVRVKEGKITVEEPKFHAYFDLNKYTSHVEANFYFDAKATADVTLTGDLTFNKSIEKCIYGYDIDLGKVAGDEKGNKAFVGIFLVIGVEGKIHLEVRTITTGDAKAGFAYKAYGYGLIPYFVGPYATFEPASFDMSFTVNGEINTTLACVPQVGVIIWGTEIGALQIWVGFKANARFNASGGGGSGGVQDLKASGSIALDAFGELVGYLLGSRYSIFYIDFPLYSGEWSVGEEASGSGGDAIKKVLPHVRVTADAYNNVVEGKIAFSTAGKTKTGYAGDDAAMDSALKPYANSRFSLAVYDKASNYKYARHLVTDNNGNFSAQLTNILPSDKIYIDIYQSPVFEIENSKYQVMGKSPVIKPTVPFSKLDFNVDTFNDIITGSVSGNYNGPVNIKIMKIIGNDYIPETITVNAVNGIFKKEYPVNQSTFDVNASISFEGSKFPDGVGVTRYRNLDALTINIFNDFKPTEAATGVKEIQSSELTIGKIADKTILLSGSTKDGQENLSDLSNQDAAGRKFIKPNKIIGTISNQGDMGWLQSQGDDYVRPGTNSSNLKYYNGNVKITAISVQSALEAMLEDMKGPHDDWIPKPEPDPWTATTQAKQAIRLRSVRDISSPIGVRIEQIPTSAGEFAFDKPDVVAYMVEIEHEGLTLTKIYNPYVYHYNNNQQSVEDFLGPFIEAVNLVTEEKIDSVVNPADVMNQWQGAWVTQMGRMELMQNGTTITGSLMQGTATYILEGTVINGVFKGSYIVPSTTGFGFGDIISVEMDISADGKSINLRNLGTETILKSLNGTRAIRQ